MATGLEILSNTADRAKAGLFSPPMCDRETYENSFIIAVDKLLRSLNQGEATAAADAVYAAYQLGYLAGTSSRER